MSSAGHVARAPQEQTDTLDLVEAVVPLKWMKMFKQILVKPNMLYTAAVQMVAARSFGSQYFASLYCH